MTNNHVKSALGTVGNADFCFDLSGKLWEPIRMPNKNVEYCFLYRCIIKVRRNYLQKEEGQWTGELWCTQRFYARCYKKKILQNDRKDLKNWGCRWHQLHLLSICYDVMWAGIFLGPETWNKGEKNEDLRHPLPFTFLCLNSWDHWMYL